MGQLSKELAAREARIAPDEARLAERTEALAQKDAELKAHEDRLTTRTQALIAQAEDQSAREMTLKEDRVVLQEARGAFESDRREFEERRTQYDEELRRRGDDLDGQAKTLGESQLRLAQETETFELSTPKRAKRSSPGRSSWKPANSPSERRRTPSAPRQRRTRVASRN